MTSGTPVPVTNTGPFGTVPGTVVQGEVDTTAVSGNAGAAPVGTANAASDADTEALLLAPRSADYVSPGVDNTGQIGVSPVGDVVVGERDTSGALGGALTTPTSTLMSGTVNTLQPGQIGAGDANPAYRAPGGLVAASIFDSTRTDVQPGGSLTNPITSAYGQTTTVMTADIGSVGSGTGATPPVAPTSVTAVTGPRDVVVSWTAPADISQDETLGYVIQNSAGGTTFAPRGATSAVVRNLTPDSAPHLNLDGTTDTIAGYTFKVAARNKAGIGPFSTASSPAVRPYNPDAADALLPGGLALVNIQNAIYNPDGTVKAGTGLDIGPAIGAVTAGTQYTKQVTVHWTAPAFGDTPTSFNILASDGTATTATSGSTSKVITFATGGQTVTIQVQAVDAAGPGEWSAPSAAITVPGGVNNAPVLGTITDGAALSKTITVTWVTPTVGDLPTGFVVTASDATTVTVGNVLTADVVFASAGGVVTFTVHAINGAGAGPWSAISASHTVP